MSSKVVIAMYATMGVVVFLPMICSMISDWRSRRQKELPCLYGCDDKLSITDGHRGPILYWSTRKLMFVGKCPIHDQGGRGGQPKG